MANAEPIAIVGMACRFPGASDPFRYWRTLRAGQCAVTEAPRARWRASAALSAVPQGEGAAAFACGQLGDISGFDWRAFGISPREAMFLDPQQRLLLEVAWEAIEDAGLMQEEIAGTRAGVFVAINANDYFWLQARQAEQLSGYAVAGNSPAIAANRISHVFDLRGPSVALDTGCASSLSALHLACRELLQGEVSLALVGGVQLLLSPESSIAMNRAGLLSQRGRCSALDASADGFVRGEGAGVVVLKRASAVQPGDRVYAYIRGSAINHAGRSVWFAAPSAVAQTQVIREALAAAGCRPEQLQYVELHGAGFPQGDVVEMQALAAALGEAAGRSECRVGSVKPSIGNLEAAAGIASLIKVALALHHREIPRTLHLETPNPALQLEQLGLRPQNQLTPWPASNLPLAGVTALSLGGANAHVVLSGADAAPALPTPRLFALPLSGNTCAALDATVVRYADWLAELQPDAHALRDICATAARRRRHGAQRCCVLGEDFASLVRVLRVRAGLAPACESLRPSCDAERELAAAAASFERGLDVIGENYSPAGRCASLPPRAWQRESLWYEAAQPAVSEHTRDRAAAVRPSAEWFAWLRAAAKEARIAALASYLKPLVQEQLGLPDELEIARTQSLFDLGISSVNALALGARIQADFELKASPTLLYDCPNLDALASWIAAELMPESACERKLT